MIGVLVLLAIAVFGIATGHTGIGWVIAWVIGTHVYFFVTRCKACNFNFATSSKKVLVSSKSVGYYHHVERWQKIRTCHNPHCGHVEIIKTWAVYRYPDDLPHWR